MRSFGSETTTSKPNKEKSDQTESNDEIEKLSETTTASATLVSPKTRRSLINRRNIYKTIERKLNALV